ncbi:ATP-binding cassette domain-containing protein [Methanolobus bombayensis]|uniref:ATP-binding cassette domain-containing protein n=1 Tax=Methanolobus bombayensis TaxID=38023 RepID=UPI001AE10509|nr:ATP-binding cassette domain-containing protein [Methanolobus bombayensis]MBP1908698.1 ABC-2 type transport system ATP-binding protein [Methanolobus bombayensis]
MKAIEVNNLSKLYPPNIRAVDDITFSIDLGEIFGLLGPNGAGKTTTLKAITTLGKPSSGTIKAFDIDIIESPQKARQMFGYVPQAVSADGDLTGYENLLIFAKLFYVNKNEREKRINNALKYMGLSDRSQDLVKHYSGGMMRRLEIAQALVNRPKVLFLDEPSIGLDPSSKRQVWEYIKKLNEEFGMTIVITTHDMLEADELCHRIAIMNSGKIAVIDTPHLLKKSIGGDIVSLSLQESGLKLSIPDELGLLIGNDDDRVLISTDNAEIAIPQIIRHFENNGSVVRSVTVNKLTLDDVFMKYARSSLQSQGTIKDNRSVRRSFARRGR